MKKPLLYIGLIFQLIQISAFGIYYLHNTGIDFEQLGFWSIIVVFNIASLVMILLGSIKD